MKVKPLLQDRRDAAAGGESAQTSSQFRHGARLGQAWSTGNRGFCGVWAFRDPPE
jgi:hypothetical protein